MTPAEDLAKEGEEKEALRNVQNFLQELKVRKLDDKEDPTSWIEVFTLYKKYGYPCTVPNPGQGQTPPDHQAEAKQV